jgi:hypothetical protein
MNHGHQNTSETNSTPATSKPIRDQMMQIEDHSEHVSTMQQNIDILD